VGLASSVKGRGRTGSVSVYYAVEGSPRVLLTVLGSQQAGQGLEQAMGWE
jgi:hypothetical protein